MPRGQKKVANGSAEFKAPSKSLLDESNPFSYIAPERSAEKDYYKLENRERQLKAIASLTAREQAYILGLAPPAGDGADAVGANEARITEITNRVNKLHEADLIELKALVYLQGLPDTSPELLMLKQYCGCSSREQIASYIAEKQMKKLFLTQIEAITVGGGTVAGGNVPTLSDVYKKAIVKGPTAFAGLFA